MRSRLLAPLPLAVIFKSVTYWLEVVQVPVSGRWQLRASWPSGYWLCACRESEEELRKAIYGDGIELAPATVAWTIFERLGKEGRGEILPTSREGVS